jgi:hypothetical protein
MRRSAIAATLGHVLYERIQKMKRRSISVLLAVFLTGVITSALAKQRNTARLSGETLTVGSTNLGIGMEKDRVVSLLAQDGFQLVPVGSNAASSKQERIKMLTFFKEPHEAVETAFEDGKLIRASKPVDFQSTDEALESLYGIIAKFQESGHTACHLDAKIKADSEGTIKIATINCMFKFMEITVMRNNAGEAKLISIAEGISDTPI